jgi:hypothetical protein
MTWLVPVLVIVLVIGFMVEAGAWIQGFGARSVAAAADRRLRNRKRLARFDLPLSEVSGEQNGCALNGW